MNNVDKHLEFKISEEENKSIKYLNLSVHRNANNIDLGSYKKPTYTDITVQFSSKHPHEHKMAAFNYYINRMSTLPITKQAKQQEWKIILAKKKKKFFNAYHSKCAEKLRTKQKRKKKPSTTTTQ